MPVVGKANAGVLPSPRAAYPIVTDACHPQVNAVVRTMERVAQKLPAFGAEAVLLSRWFPKRADADLRRHKAGARHAGTNPATHGSGGRDHVQSSPKAPRPNLASICLKRRRPPPAITRATPNISTPGCRSLNNGPMPRFAASTTPARRRWWRRRRWPSISRRRVSRAQAMDARRRYRTSIRVGAAISACAAGLPLCRARRRREELEGFPRTRSTRQQGRRRRRAGARHLRSRYPAAHFMGEHSGEELARNYASADVFVFPSRTDTFGIVLLEGLASGLPVAAYPVTGPIDVVGDAGVLSDIFGRRP